MNSLEYVKQLWGVEKQRVLIKTHDDHACEQIWIQGHITHVDDDFDFDEKGYYCLSLETHLKGEQHFYKDEILNIEPWGFYNKVPKNTKQSKWEKSQDKLYNRV